MDKMTSKKALDYVLTISDLPDDVREKIQTMRTGLDKKSNAPAKPTAKQRENADMREKILGVLAQMGGRMQISDIVTAISDPELTSHRCSALLSALVKDGRAERSKDGKQTFFTAVSMSK